MASTVWFTTGTSKGFGRVWAEGRSRGAIEEVSESEARAQKHKH